MSDMSNVMSLAIKAEAPARAPDTSPMRGDLSALTEDDGSRKRMLSDWGVVVLVAALVIGAWVISRSTGYKPGSDLGYNLGLAGGIMMLLVLIYSLRKRFKFMFKLGDMKPWFVVHIVLGIGGPFLVLLHSKFEMHSLNASVALICMLLVAGSGIVGRYIYMRIHLGLSGRHANLSELRAKHGLDSEKVKPLFDFAPPILKHLAEFEEEMARPAKNLWQSWWRFFAVGGQARIVRYRCYLDLAPATRVRANRRHWDRSKLMRRRSAYRKAIRNYLGHVQEIAQFDAYVRLFSLWHLLHIPLLYLLVASSVAHVVAVHMY